VVVWVVWFFWWVRLVRASIYHKTVLLTYP
jgi:hypothetical protein